MGALAGQIADPATYNDDVRKRVARGKRTTDSAVSTNTETMVLRLDGLYLKAGRSYQFMTSSLLTQSTVANDVIAVRLRYETADTATTSSGVVAYTQNRRTLNGTPENTHLSVDYTPVADETGSLLLTVARTGGTGDCIIAGAAAYPICVYVNDMGVDVGDTGVDLP